MFESNELGNEGESGIVESRGHEKDEERGGGQIVIGVIKVCRDTKERCRQSSDLRRN